MTTALISAGLVVAVVAWYLAVRTWYRVAPADREEVHRAQTDDGYEIALSRYLPRGDGVREHPVVLCGGLGANRFTYDLGTDRSLARRLAEMGFDVWMIELRAHGRSRARFPVLFRWTFDDHVTRDVPAALALVKRVTTASRVHFVGHSMGGVLLYTYLSRGGDDVASGIAVGSSLDYSGSKSWFQAIRRLLFLRHVLAAVPIGFFSTLTAPFAGRVRNRVDEFNVWPSNVEPKLYRRLTAICFHSVSTRVLAQLATAFEEGGLRSADGGVRYLDGLAHVGTPMLVVAGTLDRQCPPDAAQRTVDALGSPHKRLAVFGRAEGHADDYGHFDLLVGERARSEVWPVIEEWLVRNDAAPRGV